jgi:hypothetical protein
MVRGIEKVFVLHDFDISGFSILATLGVSARRYTFANKVPIIDLGLCLSDVEAMGLQSEPVELNGKTPHRGTTRRNGALEPEISFLYGDGGEPRRVELNAMTSRQIIELIERKFAEHGVTKVIPTGDVIEQHARRLIEQRLTAAVLDRVRAELAGQAAAHELPPDLDGKIRKLLMAHPALPWDVALAQVLQAV